MSDKVVETGPGEGEGKMPRKRLGAEQIILKLREAEVDLAKGQTVAARPQDDWCHRADLLPVVQRARRLEHA